MIFCLVLMFNYIANKLLPNLKDIMYIKKNPFSNPLTLMYIKSHNYNMNTNKENTKIFFLSLFFSIVYSPAFIYSTYNINNISCKFFMTLLVYQAYVKDSKDELQKKYFNIFGK